MARAPNAAGFQGTTVYSPIGSVMPVWLWRYCQQRLLAQTTGRPKRTARLLFGATPPERIKRHAKLRKLADKARVALFDLYPTIGGLPECTEEEDQERGTAKDEEGLRATRPPRVQMLLVPLTVLLAALRAVPPKPGPLEMRCRSV